MSCFSLVNDATTLAVMALGALGLLRGDEEELTMALMVMFDFPTHFIVKRNLLK